MLILMVETPQPLVAFNAALLREPYSGVEVMIHETACALAAHGTLPYRIYTPHTGTRPIPSHDRVQIRALAPGQARLRRILWEQCALPRLLRREGAQVLHAPAYLAPLAARCPVVLTVHDLHVFTHPQFCTPANRIHYRLLLPLSIRRAAAITVYSEHVRRALLLRFPAAAAKTRVIPPGLPAQFLQAATTAQRDALRARLHLPQRFLLFVGDLAPRKNLPGVLDAFGRLRAEHPDLHLVLAGAPGGWSSATAGRGGGIRWLGYVPPDDLPALYALAGALIFPSFDEGFGLPALEAMACGCPVVCSPGGAAEVCGDAALACDPASTEAIADAVRVLLTRPALRLDQVEAGRRRAAGFRWEHTVQQLEETYRRACMPPGNYAPQAARHQSAPCR
jgi:glycosyltransferase involved in cell wall biosynthesis